MPNVRYPISMDRWMFCTGHCKAKTKHAVRIYPDTEFQKCTVCGHEQTVRYDREASVVYEQVDEVELEGILSDLQTLANAVGTRNWGTLGKKDADFIDRTVLSLNATARRVRRLLEKQQR